MNYSNESSMNYSNESSMNYSNESSMNCDSQTFYENTYSLLIRAWNCFMVNRKSYDLHCVLCNLFDIIHQLDMLYTTEERMVVQSDYLLIIEDLVRDLRAYGKYRDVDNETKEDIDQLVKQTIDDVYKKYQMKRFAYALYLQLTCSFLTSEHCFVSKKNYPILIKLVRLDLLQFHEDQYEDIFSDWHGVFDSLMKNTGCDTHACTMKNALTIVHHVLTSIMEYNKVHEQVRARCLLHDSANVYNKHLEYSFILQTQIDSTIMEYYIFKQGLKEDYLVDETESEETDADETEPEEKQDSD